MGGVDLMDQKTAAYRLDRKSKFRFYLRIFFDLMDVALVNSHIVYQSIGGSKLSLLDFKIVVAQNLIGKYTNRQRSFPQNRPSKRRFLEEPGPANLPDHLPEYQVQRGRCHYCKIEGKDMKTFVKCTTCDLYLCLVKERNCFFKHHV